MLKVKPYETDSKSDYPHCRIWDPSFPSNESRAESTFSNEFAQKHLRVEGIPEAQYLCNFGIDLLTPVLFDILDYNYRHRIVTHGEIQLRDAMSEMIKQEGMSGYRVAGQRYDTGNPRELLRTVNAFGLQGPYRDALLR